MWFSAIKLAFRRIKIYANKQETKMAMSDAQLMHASRMAEGEEAYQGKLIRSQSIRLEGRGSFDNFKFANCNSGLGSRIGRSGSMDKVKLFFEMFSELPKWFTNLWILVVASIYGIKGTQIFKRRKKIMKKNKGKVQTR